MTWVYVLPPWLFFACVLVLGGALSASGLLFVRHVITRNQELTHNDVAGPIIGTVGTILAVILSFLLVTVWQEYDSAAATVAQEASAVADLYHVAGHFPPSVARRLRGTLKTYVNAVVSDEWPAMRSGRVSAVARAAASSVFDIVARYQPTSGAQQALQQDALGIISTFEDSRRSRLFANDQGIPVFFWVGNLILAAITVGFCFIFRVRSEAVHLVMTLALTTVIATIFVLIALFDYPFRGDSQIPPTIFVQLQHSLFDEPIVSNSPTEPARSRSSSTKSTIRSASDTWPNG
ncbi:MAG: hypothetical protein WB615_11940 [Candidatus Tumulicola sp.]